MPLLHFGIPLSIQGLDGGGEAGGEGLSHRRRGSVGRFYYQPQFARLLQHVSLCLGAVQFHGHVFFAHKLDVQRSLGKGALKLLHHAVAAPVEPVA